MAGVPTECPVCHQKDFQKATMARALGTNVGSTSGAAVGMTGNGNIGSAYYQSTTVTKSEVAESLSPFDKIKKERSDSILVSLFVVPGGLIFAWGGFAIVAEGGTNDMPVGLALLVGLAGIGFLVFWGVYMARAFSSERWAAASNRERAIQDTWVCLRCGHNWVP